MPKTTAKRTTAPTFAAQPPKTRAECQRRLMAVLNHARLKQSDPIVREVFTDLVDILCDAFERGGLPEIRRTWRKAKQVLRDALSDGKEGR